MIPADVDEDLHAAWPAWELVARGFIKMTDLADMTLDDIDLLRRAVRATGGAS